ncbi:ABC transporter ATP-binding protein [Undibacterium jejuense]|uniref:ABC transporter ATP-binding protein n=1 Tax=Undibacterium jejuense TaxID=1344949 RepID=A0A923HDT2_9BURK|nr:ATP-binding cassette domain-containing protein [Undibacterium jejuense]MBC3860523.1 ABC transporter ATP-binding protein [Undibacterium jejuense]
MTSVTPSSSLSGGDDAIVITDLVKRFEGQHVDAVASIHTSISRGTITGLVGPDGAGKTTFLRLLAGLLQPTSGTVSINGINPFTQSDELHEHVGYMPQKFGLYEDLSVIENLTLYADLRNVTGAEREQSFAKLLAFTDLTRFTDRYAGKLSGGMKQKLGLACALLGTPQVLLLDEPGVGVDPISRRELWKMVRELAKGGITVLWSTAYLDEAELCDDVRLMNNGTILASGAPQTLMDQMRGRCLHVSGITGHRRDVLRRALRLPEVMDGVIQGRNVRLVLRDVSKRPDMQLLDAGLDAALSEVAPRLEDAFISALGGGPGGESVLASLMPDLNKLNSSHDQNPIPVIESRDLTKRFGDFVATDHVSFKVARGEIFGLLGPNGAGKSTTFKMECGLLKPTSGQALVMGNNLKDSPSKARQLLGYMAQKFSLYAQLSVQQNLEFFSGIYGLRGNSQQKKIAQMLDAFALQPYLNTPTEKLPLGFKQRLALACAVMHEPQVLFLDEPTSGVDPVTRREFWTHINGLADKGVTIMVTTHFMDEAEYCDRIALIYRGKLLALGTPDDLKRKVATEQRPNPTMEDAFIELVLEADQ